jgi:hypothetical protein
MICVLYVTFLAQTRIRNKRWKCDLDGRRRRMWYEQPRNYQEAEGVALGPEGAFSQSGLTVSSGWHV